MASIEYEFAEISPSVVSAKLLVETSREPSLVHLKKTASEFANVMKTIANTVESGNRGVVLWATRHFRSENDHQ